MLFTGKCLEPLLCSSPWKDFAVFSSTLYYCSVLYLGSFENLKRSTWTKNIKSSKTQLDSHTQQSFAIHSLEGKHLHFSSHLFFSNFQIFSLIMHVLSCVRKFGWELGQNCFYFHSWISAVLLCLLELVWFSIFFTKVIFMTSYIWGQHCNHLLQGLCLWPNGRMWWLEKQQSNWCLIHINPHGLRTSLEKILDSRLEKVSRKRKVSSPLTVI